MPHPGVGFPQAFQEWPRVGHQWPAYNIESDQARGLEAWWPTLASYRTTTLLRDLVGIYNITPTGLVWVGTETGPALQSNSGDSMSLSPELDIAAGTDFTFTFRGKVNSWAGGSNNSGFFRSGAASGGNTFCIFQTQTGRPWIRLNNTDILKPGAGTSVPLGVDVQFAYVVSSSSTAKFYIDGVEEHSAGHATATPAFSVYYIGWQYSTGQGLYADWRGVRYYNRALTDAEVYQLYDPATRWELHQIPRRLWRLIPITVARIPRYGFTNFQVPGIV